MRAGMGNLLETDSDVASISDNERERTDGDGMESDALLDTNKNVMDVPEEPATASSDSTGTATESGQKYSSEQSLDAVPTVSNINDAGNSSLLVNSVSDSNASPIPSTSKVLTASPRELPPRSQLIQLKPTMLKPRLNSKSSTELAEGMNKQKNPRFIPYEPYPGAVRPIVAQEDSSKKHSRTASDASISSLTLEQAMNSVVLDDSKTVSGHHSQGLGSKKNTHELSVEQRKATVDNVNMNFQVKQQDQTIEKQKNALTLFKERLKIAEKDNNDLHKENTRLKKLLVDSLSGDLLPGRTDHLSNSVIHPGASHESVDALSNQLEVWRSKFLSSCVLVEQLTRENSSLHDAVGSAANILKEIKLASSLSPEHFEEVNAWLRQNRETPSPPEPNS